MFEAFNDYHFYENIPVFIGIAGFFALVCAVLSVIFITPKKRQVYNPPFFRVLADIFNLRQLFIEKVLKFFYILETFAVIFYGIIFGFGALFTSGDFGGFLVGIAIAVIGPFAVRLLYEGTVLIILLVKNVMEINSKIEDKRTEEQKRNDPFSGEFRFRDKTPYRQPQFYQAPYQQPPMGQQPQYSSFICPNCGTAYDPNFGPCPKCGTKH